MRIWSNITLFLICKLFLCAVATAQSSDSVYVDENGMVTGQVEVVKTAPIVIGAGFDYLLDHPKVPTDGFMPGMTRLMVEARLGNTSTVAALISKNEGLYTYDYAGKSALSHALEANKADVVFLLIQKGAEVSVEDVSGETVLHKAARNGMKEMITLFLKMGIPIDKTDKAGVTPLMLATANGHLEAAVVLLKNEANPNLEDHKGNTALHAWAAGMMKRSEATSAVIISKGSKKKSKKAKSQSEEEPEVESKWKKVFKTYGFDIFAKNADGLTPIEFGRKAGREDISATLESIR